MQGYCDAVMADALFDGSQNDHHRQHEACLAPIARGLVRKCVCACVRTRACACACDCVAVMLAADTCTYCTVDATLHTTKVMFAAGPAEAEAAFKNAVEHRSTTSGLQVLTWTTRWQMPDRHVPGLRAQMWWPELEAVEVLRANSAMLSREFALLLAEGGGVVPIILSTSSTGGVLIRGYQCHVMGGGWFSWSRAVLWQQRRAIWCARYAVGVSHYDSYHDSYYDTP